MTTRTNTHAGPSYPLTWLRGLAALIVLTFHAYQHNRTGPESAWPWSGVAHQVMVGSELFVDMFFVLSGFVLFLPVARATLAGSTGRPGWVLLLRRMARLVPLYYAIIIVVWALTNPSLPGHWQDLLLHLSFTHVYSDQYIFWDAGPAWSLAVEFHFYVLMALSVPLVHAAVRRTRTRSSRMVVALALPVSLVALGVGYLLWATVFTHPEPTNWSVWFSPMAKAADFGIGMGLAVLSASGVRLARTPRLAAGLLGVGALVALVLNRPETPLGAWWSPAYALALAIALSGIVLHDGPWPAAFSWRPLVWVGGLGYGIYLIHEPVMRLLDTLGALPAARPGLFFLVTALLVAILAIALAWVSSKTVESAGLKLLSTMDRNGKARDYYAHLEHDDGADRPTVSREPAGAGSSVGSQRM
ncbi:acyltransferase family protein [Nocardioides sp.]|uniref:acyltransferase family protein n=1 Tax=Nocardioides sp. TaxID=35761 RepID=UPI003D0C05DB